MHPLFFKENTKEAYGFCQVPYQRREARKQRVTQTTFNFLQHSYDGII